MTRKALIVDDEPSVRFVLRQALERAGWSAAEVDDGAEVEDRLTAERFDLILLDLYMPGMNGYEVLRRLRGRGYAPTPLWRTPLTVRIVVLSGASGEEGLAFARRIGADACLAKPFDVADVLDAVEN